MTNEINEIASKHLGKTSDGATMTPYVTPDKADPDLLVAIPRYLNRVAYDINENKLPFYGVDIWNVYEVSFINSESNYPYSGIVKFIVPADSPNIVESKSVKLYFNSYNLQVIRPHDFIKDVKRHLSEKVGAKVNVYLFRSDEVNWENPLDERTVKITDVQLFDSTHGHLTFDKETPGLIQTKPNFSNREVYHFDSLRSNCRVTNQPDWGDLLLIADGTETIEPSSMAKYIVSFRKENHFHEEVCEMIYKRLYDRFQPYSLDELTVMCFYTRRGGIDINPIRTSTPFSPSVTKLVNDKPWGKTGRQ